MEVCYGNIWRIFANPYHFRACIAAISCSVGLLFTVFEPGGFGGKFRIILRIHVVFIAKGDTMGFPGLLVFLGLALQKSQ